MSLAFLSASGSEVAARSPLEPALRGAGARFEVRDGWNVAVSFVPGAGAAGAEAKAARRAVGWADTSYLRKQELQAEAAELDATGNLRFGEAVRVGDAWWCRLTATRALVIGGSETIDGALDVTTCFGAITIAGPLAREVFARFCALDLRPAVTPVRALRPGSIARQPGLLIREDEERYLFTFGAATGEYMWSAVSDAGDHLGGRPIGADALGMLGFPSEAAAEPAGEESVGA